MTELLRSLVYDLSAFTVGLGIGYLIGKHEK